MVLHLSWFLLFFFLAQFCTSPAISLINSTFLFNGFDGSDLNLSGYATVTRGGALQLTDGEYTTDIPGITGHAFFPVPLLFIKLPAANTTQSFSTRFVFEIVSKFQESGGHGLAFVVAPSTNFSAAGGRFLGLFNESNNGNPANHIFAVEFDTSQQGNLHDLDANHVGVDVNSEASNISASAVYYTEIGKKEPVVLDNRTPIQAWIEYDGHGKRLNVTIAPLAQPLKNQAKPLTHIT